MKLGASTRLERARPPAQWLLLGLALALSAQAVHAQTAAPAEELPLSGPALVYANAAYAAYAEGNYRLALEKVREALRQRPDAASLKALEKKAQAALASKKPAAAAIKKAAPATAQVAAPPAPVAAPPTKPAPALVATPTATPAPAAAPAFVAAQAGYQAYGRGDFKSAAAQAQIAVNLAPANRDWRQLLLNALQADGQLALADSAASGLLASSDPNAPGNSDAALFVQRGRIRQSLGQEALAQGDFATALRLGNLPPAIEIAVLMDINQAPAARLRFESAQAEGALTALPAVDLAYLAARVGNDAAALAAFERADSAGQLPSSALQDSAFTAVRQQQDGQAIAYFKRAIDDANSLKLKLSPQLLFETRRAVSEVSRDVGVIASLSYRSAASSLASVPGVGLSGDSTQSARQGGSLQAGVEGYWRPWGFQNGRYAEVFARAFSTLYNPGGSTGADSLQAAVGIRYKPLSEANLVVSLSRVFSANDGRNDFLAQVAYSNDYGTDLRTDVPTWWTSRLSAEAGRYLSDKQSYALAQLQVGRSFRLDDARAVDGNLGAAGYAGSPGQWVLFPHLSLAADYDQTAAQQSAVGFGPGITARYWFRGDGYHAPRSYLDLTLQARARVAGAQRAEGVFLNSTVSY